MLILSRKKDQIIVIDSYIEIKVLEIKDDTVRLGITAPRSIPVHRKEILELTKNGENIVDDQFLK